MRVLLTLLLLFSCLVLPVARAERDPMAEPRFVTAGGTAAIVDGIVTTLAQDERGLIWVGTSVGLVRYDGYQAKAYPMSGDGPRGGRGSRFLRALLPDAGGVIWVGGDGDGLARFDTLSETWTLYHHDAALPASITPGNVLRLAKARDGGLWVGLLGGLDHFDPASGRFEHHRVADGTGLPDNRIGALLVDRAGDLWVGTWSGLVRRRAGGQRFEAVGGPELAGAVNALAQGPDGQLWVGMRSGPRPGQRHRTTVRGRWRRAPVAGADTVLRRRRGLGGTRGRRRAACP